MGWSKIAVGKGKSQKLILFVKEQARQNRANVVKRNTETPQIDSFHFKLFIFDFFCLLDDFG